MKPQGKTLDAYMRSRSRCTFIMGPLGSGKTYQSASKVLRLMCEQAPNAQGERKSRWYAVRNTYPDLLTTTIKDWLDLFGDLGVYKGNSSEPPTHRLSFCMEDGTSVKAEMVFLAMDREDSIKRLRGAQVTGFWLNEVKELRKAVIDMADMRHGRYPSAMDGGATWHGMIGDTNAPEHGHWSYELAESEVLPGWEFFKQPGGVLRAGVLPNGRVRWVPNAGAENLANLPAGYYVNGLAGKSDEWIAVNLANEYGLLVEGAYYSAQMIDLRARGRITEVPYDPGLPVDTFWDLGRSDQMVIWFHQQFGQSHRLIDFHASRNAGMDVYAKLLKDKRYHYGRHLMPHDAAVRDLGPGSKSRQEHAESLGIRPVMKVKRPKNIEEVLDGIETTRRFLSQCWIDEKTCAQGIKGLDNYRREFDDVSGKFKPQPLHNWASDIADALRTGSTGYVQLEGVPEDQLYPEAC